MASNYKIQQQVAPIRFMFQSVLQWRPLQKFFWAAVSLSIYF